MLSKAKQLEVSDDNVEAVEAVELPCACKLGIHGSVVLLLVGNLPDADDPSLPEGHEAWLIGNMN